MFKNSVRIFVEKIYEMGFLEGSGVPVLYIGRLVPKGLKNLKLIREVRAVLRLCEFYPGICLTTEEKARKILS
jgi:hypothetical protein